MSDARYARQVILPEIGEDGQARLASATARVCGGVTGEIESAYLVAAGVGRVVGGEKEAGAPPFDVRDPSARDVATAAWRALRTMRAILRGGA